jgi:hypothetical protein
LKREPIRTPSHFANARVIISHLFLCENRLLFAIDDKDSAFVKTAFPFTIPE